jgi:predicted small lipoprotein YifL
MKKSIVITALVLSLAACGNNPPVPDWQMNAKNGIDRATAAYMEGNARVEAAEYKRAREALSSTGKVDLIIRAELTQCAARVAALVFEDCAGFDKLAQDASPADRAYAAYLAGRATASDAALLPAQHQPVAAAASDAAAASAVQAITDPLSKLVASGVLLRAGKASPPVLADAVDTASAQGWRRPLLAWLGVQSMRAEQAGDSAEAQRIKRRIDLITAK